MEESDAPLTDGPERTLPLGESPKDVADGPAVEPGTMVTFIPFEWGPGCAGWHQNHGQIKRGNHDWDETCRHAPGGA